MSDPELETLRKQRMAQLQSQYKVSNTINIYLSNIFDLLFK